MIALFAQILLDTALKGAVLVALGAIAVTLAVGSAASTRHMIWSAVIGAHLALPVVTVLGPGVDLRVLPPPPWLVTDSRALTWVWVVWLMGVIVGVLPLISGSWRVARLRRGSVRVASETVGSDIDVRYSDHLSVPVVCGVLRPSILVPADASSWTEARWRLVLQHELAHVRRHDTASQLLAQIVLIAFWFDPLLSLAVRSMRREREHACDDLVLGTGVAPWDYAHELIEVARGAQRVPAMLAGLAMPGASGLADRIRAILDATRNRRRPSRRDIVLTMVVALAITIPLGALRPFRDALP
jgi:beta-lactamase regulating signal transducer with metallopeptidase domain